jgi:hypothetical protein
MNFDSIQKLSAIIGIPLLSGANIFITVASIGGLQLWGGVHVPGLEALANPWVVGIAAGIYILETGLGLSYNWLPLPVDTVKEAVKSFVTIPATGIMTVLIASGGSAQQLDPAVAGGFTIDPSTIFYFVFGSALAATTQFLKIFVRMLIDHLPESISNFAAEISEGTTAFIGSLLVFFLPYVALALSAMFLIAFVFFGPGMIRASLITYRAVFAFFKYWFEREKVSSCDPGSLDPTLIARIDRKVPFSKADKILRVVFDKGGGFKSNEQGFIALCGDVMYLVCPGWFTVKTAAFGIKDIAEIETRERVLFDYFYFKHNGNEVRMKFFKTWKPDFGLVCERLAAGGKISSQLSRQTGAT